MHRHRLSVRLLITVGAACCICLPTALAKKPDSTGGGNGGGGNEGGGSNSVSYEIVQLDSIEGVANDINENGEVVGGGDVPLYWQVTDGESVSVVGAQLSLGSGGATGGFAIAINDNGSICGKINNADTNYDAAVLWPSADAEPIVLSTAAAGIQDVNNHGIVVGSVGMSAAAWHVASDGTVVGPFLLGAGVAHSINDSNLVVGADGWYSGFQTVAWLLDWDGTNLSVVTHGPVIDPSGLNYSAATSVNEAGDIVGALQVPGNYPEAFYVNSALEPQTLPALVDNRKKYTLNEPADDINNASPPQVLGYALVLDRKYGGQQTGSGFVIWQGDSVLSLADALGSSLPRPQYLNALNDSGWIVGSGAFTYPSGGIYYPIVMIAR